MTEKRIALKEKLNEKKAKRHKYSTWEREAAEEIQNYIRHQAILDDEIFMLEWDLAEMTKTTDRAKSDAAWSLKKVLGGLL